MVRTNDIFIVGGGHAGSSAAISAARACLDLHAENIRIHLIDRHPFQTIKPRLYEYELEEVTVAYDKFLKPLGVIFREDTIEELDIKNKLIIGGQGRYHYDRLITALGSEVDKEAMPGTYNVDSYEEAWRLRSKLRQEVLHPSGTPLRIAIIGAGFTGYEVACEMPVNIAKACKEQQVKIPDFSISLFDRHEVGSSLGENPKPLIVTALNNAGIRQVSYATVANVVAGVLNYEIKGKAFHERFDIIITTTGQRPNHVLKNTGLKTDAHGRVLVNSFLQAEGYQDVYAVGDVTAALADEEHLALMSCQQGRPQGRLSGYNAVASLVGQPLKPYSQPNYVTCLDLGQSGAIYTEGWNRRVVEAGEEAKKTKRHINRERIYPPTSGDLQDLYDAGKLEFKTPLQTQPLA